MNNYYVYGHYVSGSNEPFYIGKGKENRAWVTQHRNFLWNEVTTENDYEVRILQDNMNEQGALILETELIEKYGRIDLDTGILVNMTEGGNGSVGMLFTEEYRYKLSERAKIRWSSSDYKEKQSIAQTNSWKEETIRNKRISRMVAADVKIRNSKSKKEMWKTEEYRKKNLETNRKKWEDPEYKKYRLNKLREGYYKKLEQTGYVPCPEERKKKISEGIKRHYANKKKSS
jgi:hypothetical protein